MKFKKSYTSELLCSSIVYPPQPVKKIAKSESGVSNNYWQTEDMTALKNLKKTRDVPTVKFPNNDTMSETRTVNTLLASILSAHAKMRTSLMDYTVPQLYTEAYCVMMTVSKF